MKTVIYHPFQMKVPDNYTDGTMIVWSGPLDGAASPSVVAAHSPLPKGKTFEEHVSEQQKEIMDAVPQYVLHSKEELTHGGRPCILAKHSWRADGPRVTQLQYCFLSKDKEVYTVTCSHLTDDFDKHEKAFREIIATVVLK